MTGTTPSIQSHKPKVYTELARVAIQRGLAAPLRLWVAFRAMDSAGCGIVARSSLRAFQRVYAVTDADIRYAANLSGVFFDVLDNRIEYRSLESVCVALGVKPGNVRALEFSDLRTVGAFKSACYAAWLSQDTSKQISRKNLTALWNHGEDTLRRWERARGVAVVANVVDITDHVGTDAQPGSAWRHIPRDDRPSHEGNVHTWTDRNGRTWFQTVNSYQGFTPATPRGQSRKVTRVVNAMSKGADNGGATETRHIFYDAKQLPDNYQLIAGDCLHSTGDVHVNSRNVLSVWMYSTKRPVSRAYALLHG